jgi:IMP dehydrogenase
MRLVKHALTFDDVLLVPAYSTVLPRDVEVRSRLTRTIILNIPLVSAAMDTVTEARTAIAMALEGGIGILHKNLTIEEQASQVRTVKRYVAGMVLDPLTLRPDAPLSEAERVMITHHISGIPVTDNENRLMGILTNRDVRFAKGPDQPISELMTKKKHLVTVGRHVLLEEAKRLLHHHRKERLLVVDDAYRCIGLITVKDIEKASAYPDACKDENGRLRAGAAVGVDTESQQRVDALVASGADVIVVDTAHGHSKGVIDMTRWIKQRHPETQVIAGNVATASAVQDLIEAGADAIKVGIGPGSICTTRIVAGVGVPQVTAIADCAEVADRSDVPIIADGGVKFSGEVAKAIAAGASSVMLGSMFAGTDEAPGEVFLYQGRSYKTYRGMGSIGAMTRGSRDRYFQSGIEQEKLVPEGVEGRVPYKGSIHVLIHQMVGGLRAAMGYVGCADIKALRTQAEFVQITTAGLRESHVHDVTITKETPNYRLE